MVESAFFCPIVCRFIPFEIAEILKLQALTYKFLCELFWFQYFSIRGKKLQAIFSCMVHILLFVFWCLRSLEWLHIKASVEDVDHIQIEVIVNINVDSGKICFSIYMVKYSISQDFLAGKAKKLDFRDIVINMSLGFGHLIVTTMWQVFFEHSEFFAIWILFFILQNCNSI